MNARQRRFVDEYLIDFNAARAARAAGYSERTSRQIGSRLLTDVDIAAEIRERTEMKPEEVRARLADIARGDIAEFIDDAGGTVRLSLVQMDEDGRAVTHPKSKLIRRITQRTTRHVSPRGGETETTAVEIELYPADQALVKIGEMHGLFKTRQVHENPDGSKIDQPKTKIVNIYIPHNGRERAGN